MSHANNAAIVIGANGGIGNAMLKHFQQDPSISHIFAVSRREAQGSNLQDTKTVWLQADSDLKSINESCQLIAKARLPVRYIVIASGMLHSKERHIQPEKRIEEINYDTFHAVFDTNTFMPMIWLKELTPLLDKRSLTTIAVLSARVGSITDNRLGGWYSYRASKAALNMLLRNLSIEYKRRFPKTKVISFHPGTTDTELSKPFQTSIAREKLFNADFVAQRLYLLLTTSEADGQLSFKDWDNKDIEW